MEFSKKKMKQIELLMVIAALLVLCVINSQGIMNALGLVIKIAMPFITGCAIAFVLNIVMNLIENRMLKKWTGKYADRFKRPVSIVLTFVFIVLLLVFLISMVVPQLVRAVSDVVKQVPLGINRLMAELDILCQKYPELQQQIDVLSNIGQNWDSIVNNIVSFFKNGFGDVLNSTIGIASSVVSGFTNLFIGLVFSVYVLAQKEKLAGQVKRVLSAFLPEKINNSVLYVCSLLNKNFTNFITGQCLEAVILGTMFVIAMTIFRMPYAVMIGVLIAFTALIPIVGAFIGCVVGAFLILLVNPLKALVFIVLFLVLQQIEGNLIYPRVVGSSVGLPAMWVLVAVTIGGSLFGIMGMLLFIPLISTVYALLRECVNKRNAKKRGDTKAQSGGCT